MEQCYIKYLTFTFTFITKVFCCVFQPTVLNRVPSGNQLAEKLLSGQLPPAVTSGQNTVSSSVKPTQQTSAVAKPPAADITSMSLASLFENAESGRFGLGFGSGGLLGLRGAMPKMPSFRVCCCCCCCCCYYYYYCFSAFMLFVEQREGHLASKKSGFDSSQKFAFG